MSNYHIKHLEEYFKVYRKSIREPENFWGEIAEEHFVWRKHWDKVLSWDFKKPEIKKEEEELFNVKVEKINTQIRKNKKIAFVKLKKEYPAIDIATKLGIL